MSDSWENNVDQQFVSNCSDVGLVHGDGCIGLIDSRHNHSANDLLVSNSTESWRVFQGYDASLDYSLGNSVKVSPIDISFSVNLVKIVQCMYVLMALALRLCL